MSKDRDLEWRLVATKGRESCRWQTADNSAWIALTLGAQGDITKVVVTASDGRSEVVDGYELGLNVARRWRSDWKQSDAPRSSTSGPWLPPLPGGRASDGYGEDPTPQSYPPDSIPPRSTVPPASDATRSTTPLSPTSRTRPSVPPDPSPLSPSRPGDSPQSRTSASQSLPPGKPHVGAGPVSTGSFPGDERDSRDRSWPPRTSPGASSSRSVNRPVHEIFGDSGKEHSGSHGASPGKDHSDHSPKPNKSKT